MSPYVFGSVWVAEWPPFGKVDHIFSLCFNYLYFKLFPVLVLRAGFRIRLLQFLIVAYFYFYEGILKSHKRFSMMR